MGQLGLHAQPTSRFRVLDGSHSSSESPLRSASSHCRREAQIDWGEGRWRSLQKWSKRFYENWTVPLQDSIQYLLLQVLEYYPSPWNTWVKIGNLPTGRALHAVLPIGPQHVACVAGEALVDCPSFVPFNFCICQYLISDQKWDMKHSTHGMKYTGNLLVKHTLYNLSLWGKHPKMVFLGIFPK